MGRLTKDGAVLGIDVGFSAKKKTTGIALMEWDAKKVTFETRRTGSDESERRLVISELVGKRKLAAVAVDGPLCPRLRTVQHYRAADAILSRGCLQRRGKPGATSSPTGQQLHEHATRLAKIVLGKATVADASHLDAIHQKRVVEAFPNIYLAALIDDWDFPKLSRDASDRFWEIVVDKSDRLEKLIHSLLPGCRLTAKLEEYTHHEDRAGIVCALTALAVAAGSHIAVGDPLDGDIILPPTSHWGADAGKTGSWLGRTLRQNVVRVRDSARNRQNHKQARVATAKRVWFP